MTPLISESSTAASKEGIFVFAPKSHSSPNGLPSPRDVSVPGMASSLLHTVDALTVDDFGGVSMAALGVSLVLFGVSTPVETGVKDAKGGGLAAGVRILPTGCIMGVLGYGWPAMFCGEGERFP
mmetsp:Transcript_9881/g.18638  ORF Transcript_9881/g.18638 Transcript_9881/m.18638 type:complete len:124 (+) Transcript_9881:855-1226(+)